eukprot:CAMPEP_0203636346 /NCGR_PEP_ID=MMETSP0088-20131115/2909_1 /ASSEMBLY_ACC=CAM_ASM_001087 /TAXON_ID=426623 /ORGANISM="Chaetoceros affinis, Strain CCMP159" /LENGTH=342 /DNA_ID=CAMNT_0050490455 /DNA_START=130 /DNA_END=1158 /DNA_ORIENTATION=+
MLKKLIKELPSLVPSDDVDSTAVAKDVTQSIPNNDPKRYDSPLSITSSSPIRNSSGNLTADDAAAPKRPNKLPAAKVTRKASIGTSPGEIAFFKFLRAELNKASCFFGRAKQELSIREERLRNGIEILKQPGSTMVNEKWSCMAKATYRLYKDLLLLELYAIMTYTSFSKILKKHDKNTGYSTRVAFMANIVNKANFTHYPDLLQMIHRCEARFESVDSILATEGKSSSALDEDERLFISMIHRFYGQIMDKAAAEGADITDRKEKLVKRQSIITGSPKQKPECEATASLKSLVEENDASKEGIASSACLSDDPDDVRGQHKRPLKEIQPVHQPMKKSKVEP